MEYESSARIAAPPETIWSILTDAGGYPRGTTRFEMREVFSGPMLGMIGKRMPDLGPSFERWAAGLKDRAEAEAR